MNETAPANEITPAPAEALAENGWWGGQRCVCGLPAFGSLLGPSVLVHPYWQKEAGAYLNAHPHNVQVAH
jgi:hypothetical protein